MNLIDSCGRQGTLSARVDRLRAGRGGGGGTDLDDLPQAVLDVACECCCDVVREVGDAERLCDILCGGEREGEPRGEMRTRGGAGRTLTESFFHTPLTVAAWRAI